MSRTPSIELNSSVMAFFFSGVLRIFQQPIVALCIATYLPNGQRACGSVTTAEGMA